MQFYLYEVFKQVDWFKKDLEWIVLGLSVRENREIVCRFGEFFEIIKMF